MQCSSLLSIPIQNPRISHKFVIRSVLSPRLETVVRKALPLSLRLRPRLRRNHFLCFSSSSSSPNGKNGEEPEARDGSIGKERREPSLFNLRLRELLEPDPENVLAVGLTGVLAWASLQVLSQLFFISLAILVAAILPEDPNEDLHGFIGDQYDPLLKHEEDEKTERGVSEVGLIRSSSSLPVKFAERRRINGSVARLDFSEDRATFTAGGYQPIADIWDMDSEEEHLISQHVRQRSNSKVRSIIESFRRMLGLAL